MQTLLAVRPEARPEQVGASRLCEEAAMINWAWRALYAEVTRAHIDDKPLDINAAYARFVRLAHMRLQAYG
jgi:hypothetical protein